MKIVLVILFFFARSANFTACATSIFSAESSISRLNFIYLLNLSNLLAIYAKLLSASRRESFNVVSRFNWVRRKVV